MRKAGSLGPDSFRRSDTGCSCSLLRCLAPKRFLRTWTRRSDTCSRVPLSLCKLQWKAASGGAGEERGVCYVQSSFDMKGGGRSTIRYEFGGQISQCVAPNLGWYLTRAYTVKSQFHLTAAMRAEAQTIAALSRTTKSSAHNRSVCVCVCVCRYPPRTWSHEKQAGCLLRPL